ncbi:MAG TPA: hypothetical protein ENN49_08500 [Bacteroidales bacterium]|nr:hypothetical protein [Bacteroidales bacterium]
MSNEVIHGFIRNLDEQLSSSLVQLEKVALEVSEHLIGNPEYTSDEFTPALIKHFDIRRKSISYLKLMLKLRSFLNNDSKYILNFEKSSGIRIDRISEQMIINEKMPAYLSNNLNLDALNMEVYTSKAYQRYFEETYNELMRADRFEACSILETMKFSNN